MASWDLTQANTLRLPCVAEQYAAPTTLAALQDVLHQARQQRRPMTLLGGGAVTSCCRASCQEWSFVLRSSSGGWSGVAGRCWPTSGRG